MMAPPHLLYSTSDLADLPVFSLKLDAGKTIKILISKENRLLELRVFNNGNSAFLNDSVISSARILYAVPLNPVLLFLHAFQHLLQKEKVPFIQLSELLQSFAVTPEQGAMILGANGVVEQLRKVSNQQTICGEEYVQVDKKKLVDYLKQLYQKAYTKIMSSHTLFANEMISEEKVEAVCVQMLVDYMSMRVGEELVRGLGLKRSVKEYERYGMEREKKKKMNEEVSGANVKERKKERKGKEKQKEQERPAKTALDKFMQKNNK